MFIDDFPPELFDKVVDFLESEDSWVLEEEVEMSLDDDEANVYREYPDTDMGMLLIGALCL